MASDKRREQRVPASWAAKVNRTNREVISGRTKNITTRGVQIELAQPLPEGEKVLMEITALFHGRKNLLRIVGQVTYTLILAGSGAQGHGVGINFLSLAAEDKEFIDSYITSKLLEIE